MRRLFRCAHFTGKYDASKAKMFWLWTSEPDTWYSPSQIHWITGVPISTVRWQCRRLHTARPVYIKRRVYGDKWHAYCYQYQLGARGLRWWVNALSAGMPISRYLEEMVDWQRQRDGIKNEPAENNLKTSENFSSNATA
jgi:hypothetical protein